MADIFLVTASHWSVPGLHMKAFKSKASAIAQAVMETNDLLRDNGDEPDATPETWEDRVLALQDEHGEQYTFVEIATIELEE